MRIKDHVCNFRTTDFFGWDGWQQCGCGRYRLKPKGDDMRIRDFAVEISKMEGKKEQISIAQILEVLKVINGLLGHDDFYTIIKGRTHEVRKVHDRRCKRKGS